MCSLESLKIDLKGLKEGDDSLIQKNMGNDLEAPATSILPEIAIVLKELTALGFTLVGMSGSGSCCFALTTDLKKAKEAYKRLEDSDYTVRLCDVIR